MSCMLRLSRARRRRTLTIAEFMAAARRADFSRYSDDSRTKGKPEVTELLPACHPAATRGGHEFCSLPDCRFVKLYSCNRERQAGLPWLRPLTAPRMRSWKRVASS